MPRIIRKLALLAKMEATYSTDPTPTGVANAMQMTDVSIDPLTGSEEARGLLLPHLGHQGIVLTGDYVRISGMVEIAGAGAAGDVPAYGPLLRACGFSETITAATKVDYDPVSDAFESVTCYYNLDGVNHIMLGARGSVELDFTSKQIPKFKFTLTGLLGTIADTALPAADLSSFVTPLPVSKAATTLSLHGAARIAETISINVNNSVEPRHLIGSESVEITDRETTGQATLEASTLADVDWFGIAIARTRAALALNHGTVAGNIVAIDAPAVEIGRPTEGQTQKILNYQLPLMFVPATGNDELTISVK